MENLTKDSLNNQIVTMKKQMKRIKALTINGLINKCRKLTKSPHTVGREPLKKDKAIRLLMEINEIKKLNAEEITKFALIHTGKFSDVAKQGSIKDRALARLTEHKLLTASVAQFRTKYPKWDVQVPSLFHIWEFNKKMMGKNLKPTQKNEITSRKVEKEPPSKKIKCSNKSINEKNNTIIKPAVSKALLNVMSQNEVETEDAHDAMIRPSLTQLIKNFKSKPSQNLKKTDGEMEVQQFNLNDDVGTEIPINNTSKSKSISEAQATNSNKSKVKNSFFITSDNEDAASSSDETGKDNFDLGDNNSEQMQLNKLSKGARFSSGRKGFQENTHEAFFQKKMFRSVRDPGITKSKRFTKQPPMQLPKAPKMPNAGKWTNGKAALNSTKLATPHLHPSWEAKRKQSITMSVAFEGKKIKFGDD